MIHLLMVLQSSNYITHGTYFKFRRRGGGGAYLRGVFNRGGIFFSNHGQIYDCFFVIYVCDRPRLEVSEGSCLCRRSELCNITPLTSLGLLHKVGWALANWIKWAKWISRSSLPFKVMTVNEQCLNELITSCLWLNMTKTINTSSVVSILLHKTLVGGGHLFQGKFFLKFWPIGSVLVFFKGGAYLREAPIQRFKVLTYFQE